MGTQNARDTVVRTSDPSTSANRGDVREQLAALERQNKLYQQAYELVETDCNQWLALFQHAPVGLFVVDATGAIGRVNRLAADALGVAPDALLGAKFQTFVSEPSAALFAEHLTLSSTQMRSASSDLLLLRADGTSFWARTRSQLSPASVGALDAIIMTVDPIDDSTLDMHARIDDRARTDSHGSPISQAHCGSILLIDDEELILNSVSRVLHRMGYSISSYTDPRDALAAFEQSPGAFDAIISDYQMPHLNGLELCEQFSSLRSDVPILLTSAYIGEIDLMRAKEAGIEYVMPKPLSADELAFWLGDVMPEQHTSN